MITIQKSETADTRTCDFTKADKATLEASSVSHIRDVYMGLRYFQGLLEERARLHDWDKISEMDHFLSDFVGGFKETGWWDEHRKINRHHIDKEDGRREDINLIDVLEHIVDCVMAGMARSGSVFDIKLPDEVLQLAVKNTVEELKENVEVDYPRPDEDGAL